MRILAKQWAWVIHMRSWCHGDRPGLYGPCGYTHVRITTPVEVVSATRSSSPGNFSNTILICTDEASPFHVCRGSGVGSDWNDNMRVCSWDRYNSLHCDLHNKWILRNALGPYSKPHTDLLTGDSRISFWFALNLLFFQASYAQRAYKSSFAELILTSPHSFFNNISLQLKT